MRVLNVKGETKAGGYPLPISRLFFIRHVRRNAVQNTRPLIPDTWPNFTYSVAVLRYRTNDGRPRRKGSEGIYKTPIQDNDPPPNNITEQNTSFGARVAPSIAPGPRRIDCQGIKRARYTVNRVGLKSTMYPAPKLTRLDSHILGPVVHHV